jgi:nucleoid DNA-binding protein
VQLREVSVIKLDIVNAIVQKTNITRTKAEQAVETVFEAMKNALGRGERIELRRFGAPDSRLASRPARQCASSQARNCKHCQRLHLRNPDPREQAQRLESRYDRSVGRARIGAQVEVPGEVSCCHQAASLSGIVARNIFSRRTSNSHEPRQRPQPPPD